MNIKEKLIIKTKDFACEKPITMAFLGDSVTHGCFECIEKGENGPIDCIYDNESVYSNLFKKKFNSIFSNCPLSVINAGISGGSAKGGLSRLDRDVISYKPDIAVVCFGLNDVYSGDKDSYINSLDGIFKKLTENEIATVFMTPNMLCTSPYKTPIKSLYETSRRCSEVQNSGLFDEFIKDASQIARQDKVLLCDCYNDWKELEKYGVDITYLLSNRINHPTRDMHNLFASKLFDTIFFKNNK